MTTPFGQTGPSTTTASPATPASPRLGLGPFGIAVRVVVTIGILIIANLTASLVPGALSVIPGAVEIFGGPSPWGFALAFVLQVMVLAVVVLGVRGWMRWVERSPIRAAGWRLGRRSIAWLLLGVAVAAASVLAVMALLPATGPVLSDEELIGDQEATPWLVALLIVNYLGLAFVQQAIPEELLFRGMLLWTLRDRPVVAVAVTTLAFTVIHLVSNGGQQSAWEHVLYLAQPFGFALLAVGLLLWTGSLWAAVGVHGGFHIGNYLAAGFLHQVTPVTSWLAVGGTQASIGLVLIVTALRRGKRILDGEN
ncbi:lysostaphin resistance A-like protein [Herbiconiux sp. YIM B11900]|uniref:CPBP family intramembrane glutamic endopeptidase n=1 Tax=Herbiconiux sp. YIM B11900 TaxID=3404131 RepID=UPI003F836540